MQRTIEVEVSLNGLQVQNNPEFCEGDKDTHFLSINFMNDLDLAGYTLQIYYLPPYPAIVPLVDVFRKITANPFKVPIPDEILERNGKVKVEFSLSKEPELITINKTFDFEVKRTINGTCLTAYPTGELKLTIAQQIEKIKALLADTDTKIAEYNNNATEKTQIFNDNSTEKLKAYNDNDTLKTKNYNDNASSKTTEFNNNASKKLEVFNTKADEKATEAANTAALEANKLVVAQQAKSVKAVEDTGSTEIKNIEQIGSEAIGAVGSAKETAVSEGKKELDNYVTNTSKVQLNNYVDNTSKVELDNYIEQTSKVELDDYVANTSKVELDNYVTEKESQIKGATYTPSISPSGDLSFTNDKGLHNPETVNLKGEKGDPGNFIFKVENGHLVLYTVENGTAPTFNLENGHLIMEIV